ncbi:DUF7504 family protein [Halorussus marinus]|uniref:DUF7504 family protein n=1 Tax=Halorussus marinus TaxID=2505976 RepID=UPI00109186F7|nr:hypothetical protein [Halorussus marinus]
MPRSDSGRFSLDPGEQALVASPSMEPPLATLPDGAFENLLVVSATASPRKIESLVERRGRDPSAVGVIPITGSPSEYDGRLWTTDPVGPSDLTGISMRLSRALEYVSRGGWVVFDSLNVLLMYGREDAVYRLLDSVVPIVRDRDACGAYFVVRQAITDETEARFRGLFDAAVDAE